MDPDSVQPDSVPLLIPCRSEQPDSISNTTYARNQSIKGIARNECNENITVYLTSPCLSSIGDTETQANDERALLQKGVSWQHLALASGCLFLVFVVAVCFVTKKVRARRNEKQKIKKWCAQYVRNAQQQTTLNTIGADHEKPPDADRGKASRSHGIMTFGLHDISNTKPRTEEGVRHIADVSKVTLKSDEGKRHRISCQDDAFYGSVTDIDPEPTAQAQSVRATIKQWEARLSSKGGQTV